MEESELLSTWEAEAAIPMSKASFADWLKDQTPDTWHVIVSSWNWDDDCAPLTWIVQQPDCDFGTGLTLFGVEGPNWMTTRREDLEDQRHIDIWDACDIIVRRWLKGSFNNAELALTPAHKGMRVYRTMEPRHRKDGKTITWDVPAFVDNYTGHRQAKSDYAWMNGSLYPAFHKWKRDQGYEHIETPSDQGSQSFGQTRRTPPGSNPNDPLYYFLKTVTDVSGFFRARPH